MLLYAGPPYSRGARRATTRLYKRLFSLGYLGLTLALLGGLLGLGFEAMTPGITSGRYQPSTWTLFAMFAMTATWGSASKYDVDENAGLWLVKWTLLCGYLLVMLILSFTIECVPTAEVSGYCLQYSIVNGYSGMALTAAGLGIGYCGAVLAVARSRTREREMKEERNKKRGGISRRGPHR